MRVLRSTSVLNQNESWLERLTVSGSRNSV